jgi:hypothetical protein
MALNILLAADGASERPVHKDGISSKRFPVKEKGEWCFLPRVKTGIFAPRFL